MRREKNKKCIARIAREVRKIKDRVAGDCAKTHKELKMFESFKDVKYLPTPFEIADSYGIRYEFIEIDGNVPAYLSEAPAPGIIYISNQYSKESIEARFLCAHELGHYFLHDYKSYAMNDDILNEYLPEETMKEYEANVFSLLLMPQFMGGCEWEKHSPKILNRKVYKKVFEKKS